jgi:hypothetical protein
MKKFINKKIGADDRYQNQFEGGGLNADALATLNRQNNDPSLSQSMLSRAESRMSDDTHIPGLGEFTKYGDMFQELTKRHKVETFHMDVIEMCITYDSKHVVAISK